MSDAGDSPTCERLSEALLDADAVVVVTPWPDFRRGARALYGNGDPHRCSSTAGGRSTSAA